ncbi:MAG: hypothetical protein K9M54_11795 [Kiritimatiellales bacterium]|nr:hypothetical protein [Kiritimatiellales bacterium]
MKTVRWIMAAMMVAGMAQATVETNFFADFTGSQASPLTATALDNGTAVGSWIRTTVGTTSTATNGAIRLDTNSNGYDYTAALGSVADSSAGTVTLSYDIRNIRSAVSIGGKASEVLVKDAGGDVLVNLRISSTNSGANTELAIDTTSGFSPLSTNLWPTYSNTNTEPPTDWDHVEVVMGASGVDVYLNSALVGTNIAYRNTLNQDITDLQFFGTGTSQSGAWYDNVMVTSTKVKETYFYAYFNHSPDGSAGSATASNLNAGTLVGSWTVEAVEESYVTNGIVAWDQGLYTNLATLATTVDLASNPVFSYDVRGKRAAAALGGKASGLRVQNENGATIINISYSCTASAGQLRVWDAVASAWTNLTDNLLGNIVTPPSVI